MRPGLSYVIRARARPPERAPTGCPPDHAPDPPSDAFSPPRPFPIQGLRSWTPGARGHGAEGPGGRGARPEAGEPARGPGGPPGVRGPGAREAGGPEAGGPGAEGPGSPEARPGVRGPRGPGVRGPRGPEARGGAPPRGGSAQRCFPLPAPSRYQGLHPWTPGDQEPGGPGAWRPGGPEVRRSGGPIPRGPEARRPARESGGWGPGARRPRSPGAREPVGPGVRGPSSPGARRPGSPEVRRSGSLGAWGPAAQGPGGRGARRSGGPRAREPGAQRPRGPGPWRGPPRGGIAYRRSPLPDASRHQRLRPWPPRGLAGRPSRRGHLRRRADRGRRGGVVDGWAVAVRFRLVWAGAGAEPQLWGGAGRGTARRRRPDTP